MVHTMGQFHPQVVHFAVALLVLGVLLRAVSLLGRPAFVAPAATLILVLGTIAIVVAAQTGQDAHGPVEQMPGVRPAGPVSDMRMDKAQRQSSRASRKWAGGER